MSASRIGPVLLLLVLVSCAMVLAACGGSSPRSASRTAGTTSATTTTRKVTPTISPDAAIVYRADVGPEAVGANGKGVIRLPGTGDPLISPDGSKIAETSLEAVDVLDTKTGKVRRIGPNDAGDPVWSPDSSALAWGAAGGLRVLPVGGRKGRTFPVGDIRGATLSWSPDGTRIAFDVGEGISVVSLATGTRRLIVAGYQSFLEPAWAPSGDRIAYVDSEEQLHVVGADGRGDHLATRLPLDPFSVGPLHWSPDGQTIACKTSDGIFAVDVATGSTRKLLEGDYSARIETIGPTWSPDSRWLAFDRQEETYSDVWVVNRDGSGLRRVTGGVRNGGDNIDPQWDPLGRPTSRLPRAPRSTAIPSSTLTERELRTTAPVTALAADGTLVALVAPENGCGAPELWRVGRRQLVTISDTECVAVGPCTARPCQTNGGETTDQVAVAGTRVLWAHEGREGNTPFADVLMATVDRPVPVVLDQDAYADGLLGSGRLLVYRTWGEANPAVVAPQLRRVVDGQAVNVRGRGLPVSVDAGRVALLSSNGVRVADAAGATIETLAVPNIRAAVLDGTRLLVLHGSTLDVYVAGRRTTEFGGLADARLEDSASGLTVLTTGREVIVRDIASGRRATFAPAGRAPLHAQIEPAGLVYSYTVPDHKHPGRIRFIPLADLRRALH